jgi:hypothetical protein
MLQIQPGQIQPVNFRCRFEMMAADAPSGHDFCVFDFPGRKGCPKAQRTVRTVGSSEDPMKSEALRAWLRALPAPKIVFRSNQGGQPWIRRNAFKGRTWPCPRNVSRKRTVTRSGSAFEVAGR